MSTASRDISDETGREPPARPRRQFLVPLASSCDEIPRGPLPFPRSARADKDISCTLRPQIAAAFRYSPSGQSSPKTVRSRPFSRKTSARKNPKCTTAAPHAAAERGIARTHSLASRWLVGARCSALDTQPRHFRPPERGSIHTPLQAQTDPSPQPHPPVSAERGETFLPL